MWLLKLPAVANTASAPNVWRKILANISFTVVLPLEPVMPNTNGLISSRHAEDRVCRAVSVSSTFRQPETAAKSSRDTNANAPFSSTCCTKSCASWFSPTSATNKSPASACRLSVMTRLITRSVSGWGRFRVWQIKFRVKVFMFIQSVSFFQVA